MIRLLRLSATLLAGRRFWLLPFVPLLWLGFQAVLLLFGTRVGFEPEAAQNTLIGLPVAVLAVFLGGRIIVGELDQRSLEIAYTAPGGAHRVWTTRLLAALLLLVKLMKSLDPTPTKNSSSTPPATSQTTASTAARARRAEPCSRGG